MAKKDGEICSKKLVFVEYEITLKKSLAIFYALTFKDLTMKKIEI